MLKKDCDWGLPSVVTRKQNHHIFRNKFLKFSSLFVLGFLLILILFSTIVNAYWPMQGYNCCRIGFSSNPGPITAELKWYYDFGEWIPGWSNRLQDNASPVVGLDNTIYQITEDYLFAIKPDGTLKWKVGVSGRLAPALSPDGTRIYAPTSIFGGITALNIEDGSQLWEYTYPGGEDASYSSLAVDNNGTIYIGTRLPASLYALNPNKTLKWVYTYPNSNNIGIEAPPAIGPDGSVYCIVNTVGLVALDSNGTFKWSNGDNCGDYGWPTPCVLSDGTIVIAGDFYSQGIIAYNPNGTKKWQRLDIGRPGGYFPGVAVSKNNGTVYTARSGGKMYALNAQTGATKWSTIVTSGENLDGSPALASNGVIYMMGTEGHLYAVRELDGTLLWQYELNTSSFFWGPQSPALGQDGTLYAVAPGTVKASGNIQARLYAFNSDTIKIATWNILNFPGTTGANRIDDFKKILDELDLDILVVQEMLNQQGVDQFLNQVLNYKAPKLFKKAPFFDGPDTDNAAFYNKKTITLISHQQIATALRDISEYYFKIKKGPGKGTKFRLYSVNLKAGTSSSDKNKRKDEAKILRDYLNTLPPDSLFVVCGDFNFYTSQELGFKMLTGSQSDNDGRVKDPINKLGKWHDKKKYADIHSQSTRKTQFGGGASGGLDDRFDMFLISYGLDKSTNLTYKQDSYVVYGNDGKHLNKSINKPTNKTVSKDIADALYEASDHLPVIVELEPPTSGKPSKPTNLKAESESSSKVELSWKDNSKNETGFWIERKNGTSVNWTQIADVGANTTNYTDSKLSYTTTYTYRVCAYNNAGSSEYSNTVNITPGSDITVYVTNTGKKYHRGNCRYLSQSKIPIKLSEAKKQGYTACSVCKPPSSPKDWQ